jgi:hypothetical protein
VTVADDPLGGPAKAPTHPSDVTTKDNIKLPLWMWVVGGAVALGLTFYVYKARKASAAQQAANAAATTTPAPAQGAYDPTTILPMFQGGTTPAGGQLPAQDNTNLAYTTYIVTGNGDTTPQAVAIKAMQLQPTDTTNISYYATLITLENPTVTPPYPIGTHLRVPSGAGTPYTAPSSAPPLAVGNLHANPGGPGTLYIVWDSPVGSSADNLHVTNTTNGKTLDYTLPSNFATVSTTSHMQSGLPSGVPYTYTVTPTNAGGAGPASTITAKAP